MGLLRLSRRLVTAVTAALLVGCASAPSRFQPLPEALSADLCSLLEAEDRACFTVEIVFDKDGKKRRHKFARGLMRKTTAMSRSCPA